MNGSITVPGVGVTSAEGQQRSKSPWVMTLESTKILCIVRRPSSTSTWVFLPAADGLVMLTVSPDFLAGGGSGGVSMEKVFALLSISWSAVWTSLSLGKR